VVHKSMKDTPVFVSIHGRNQWDFKIVAPTLATFLQALGGWVSICFLQTHVEISSDDDDMLTHVYDEDCKYLEVIESSLRAFLSTILDQEQVNNFLNFFSVSSCYAVAGKARHGRRCSTPARVGSTSLVRWST